MKDKKVEDRFNAFCGEAAYEIPVRLLSFTITSWSSDDVLATFELI